jgi:glutamate N-acetyltransferase/amino-acid N-acetyltransferase
VFTRNRFCAAPVQVARSHLTQNSTPRFLLINSGNANAGTGDEGYAVAMNSCCTVANLAMIEPEQVLPFSTGVIGEQLAADAISNALPNLLEQLHADAWLSAAEGIMTTDTLAKGVSRELQIDGQRVSITGICKGSGMIRPDMATMLAYVATDAQIDSDVLARCLGVAVAQSFNSISVDGDTSTNDACVLMATGTSGVVVDTDHAEFMQVLNEVFRELAQSIVRDGEGATKFIEIEVSGAKSTEDARTLGYTIAHSPLVKTALFASDPNWGRILAAIGRAEVDELDVKKLDLYIGNTRLLHAGLPDPTYREEKGQKEMAAEEIRIRVALNNGEQQATIWTTDLSYEYVKINAEYRS